MKENSNLLKTLALRATKHVALPFLSFQAIHCERSNNDCKISRTKNFGFILVGGTERTGWSVKVGECKEMPLSQAIYCVAVVK